MTRENLFILVGMPAHTRDMLGQEQVQALLQAHPQVRVEIATDPAQYAALLPKADAIMVFGSRFKPTPDVFKPGSRLRWIQSLSAGVEHLLTPELIAADHITFTAMKGPMGPLMAEHVALLMLALARSLPGFLQDQAERHWHFIDNGKNERPMAQMYGRTIAILGVGSVGGSLARLCQIGFGMRVLGLARTRQDHPHVDRYFERAELHDALAEADVVALCLALTPDTKQIIDAAALAAMKPTAYLINIARGGLVDETALIEALEAGRLAGAGLDATVTEPLPADSPLWTMPNVIITPHVAPGRDRLFAHNTAFAAENIRRFVNNEPLRGLVDRQAGY